MAEPQPCKYCKTMIIWDTSIPDKRKWREVNSNATHTYDKCRALQNETTAAPPEAPPTVDNRLKTKLVANLEKIHEYEQVVKQHLGNKGEKNPNPQKVGLYVKLLMEMDKQ